MAIDKRIIIVGAGPASCALACFLSERQISCTVFDAGNDPSLVVGESLLPAVIPILRRLKIEERVAEFSTVKKGAALRHANGVRVNFAFEKQKQGIPDYAYNVPRPQFDQLLRQRALELGVQFVSHKVDLKHMPGTEQSLQLDERSLAAANIHSKDDIEFLIDATGRHRLFSRKLNLPVRKGPRKDLAYFGHFENFSSDSELPGQVVISVLKNGWSWQIPLPGKTSVGVVLNKNAAVKYGDDAKSRLLNVIADNSLLNANEARLIGDVASYSNYQLISEQGYGPGWALLGDAFGFVDPMLSPGLFMALKSAEIMDEQVFSGLNRSKENSGDQITLGLQNYTAKVVHWHQAWSSLIEYFYDGRMLQLGEARNSIRRSKLLSLGRWMEPVVSKSLARQISGAATCSALDQSILQHTMRYLVDNKSEQTSALEIRTAGTPLVS